MSNITTLSSKFQISIPKSVREEKGWRAGQKFAFVPRGGHVMLVPVPSLEDTRGIMKGADPTGYRDREDRF